ncbi:MAG TPA: class I SAM-dependent methyltransferase [Acidimicrobiales bacterium]|nr:class I SAM-dependent methyltransferase [Acidimicrobiales bacterium]
MRKTTRIGALLATGAVAGVLAVVRRERRGGSRPVFARWYGVLARRAESGEIGRRRHALLTQASGSVLDIGAGTGEAFKHLAGAVTALVALDPDPAMLRQAVGRLPDVDVPAVLVRARSEGLPFATATFDTVVACLVLCTVGDLALTVAELHRVLRPGGRLLLMEHVRASEEALAQCQDLVERPWGWLHGGCHPNRRTLEALGAAGFRLDALERYGFPVLPHVQGVAVRL